MTKDHEEWLAAMSRSKDNYKIIWNPRDHPGCMMTGTLHMNRVPGRFYIQAQGEASGYDFDPYKTNLSHQINHLSFQQVLGDSDRGHISDAVPRNFGKLIRPFDGNVYANAALHESFHHYIKLVPTNTLHYQVVQSSQLSLYHDLVVPEAKFQLDFSPIAVTYRVERRPWYDYVTTVFAIVGGTFTLIGMIESAVRFIYRWMTTVQRKSRTRPIPQQEKREIHYHQPVPVAMGRSYR